MYISIPFANICCLDGFSLCGCASQALLLMCLTFVLLSMLERGARFLELSNKQQSINLIAAAYIEKLQFLLEILMQIW